MKIWMHGIFGAILAGSLWTCFWQIIVTTILVISTGAAISIRRDHPSWRVPHWVDCDPSARQGACRTIS